MDYSRGDFGLLIPSGKTNHCFKNYYVWLYNGSVISPVLSCGLITALRWVKVNCPELQGECFLCQIMDSPDGLNLDSVSEVLPPGWHRLD